MFRTGLVLFLSMLAIGCGDSTDKIEPVVTIEPPPVIISQIPLPMLSVDNKVEEVATFIQLAYQVQYFHPSDGVNETNWDEFISYGIFRIAKTNNNDDFVALLRELFTNIAPNLKINGQSAFEVDAPKETDTVSIWYNKGYKDPNEVSSSVYERQNIVMEYSVLKDLGYLDKVNYRYTLPLSIEIDLPIVLAVIDGQTLPESKGEIEDFDNYEIETVFTNTYARLVAAGQLWAVIQHFYPYLNELELNWQNELAPLLTGCIESTDSCGMAMRKLLAKTGDNHNYISSIHTSLGSYAPPIGFTWLNNKVLAVYKETDDIGVDIGDELVAIDGIDIESILEEKKPFSHRAENRKLQLLTNFDLLRGEEDKVVELTLKGSDGIEYQLTTRNSMLAQEVYGAIVFRVTSNNNNIHLALNDGIHYVNLGLLEGENVDSTLEQIKEAKGIVLDLRNYPNWAGWRGLLSHFTDRNLFPLPMYESLYIYPNQYSPNTHEITQYLSGKSPVYDIPIVVLASSYSISQNEHALGYVQDANIPIIGDETYGINGNVSYIHLLGGSDNGGVSVLFTGMKVTQHDGSMLRGVGIQPDIRVPITIDAIKNNTDIQLQAAVEYLLQEH